MSGRTNRVWRALTAVVAVAGLLMASCSNSRDATDIRLVIGVAQANLSEPWREVMNAEILETASDYPGVRIVFTNAGDSRATQESDIDKLMRSGIDLLIVSPVESQEMTPAIREAYAVIPVIVLDKAVEGYDYSLFVGVDNHLVADRPPDL